MPTNWKTSTLNNWHVLSQAKVIVPYAKRRRIWWANTSLFIFWWHNCSLLPMHSTQQTGANEEPSTESFDWNTIIQRHQSSPWYNWYKLELSTPLFVHDSPTKRRARHNFQVPSRQNTYQPTVLEMDNCLWRGFDTYWGVSRLDRLWKNIPRFIHMCRYGAPIQRPAGYYDASLLLWLTCRFLWRSPGPEDLDEEHSCTVPRDMAWCYLGQYRGNRFPRIELDGGPLSNS